MRRFGLICLLICLTGCGAAATPFPVDFAADAAGVAADTPAFSSTEALNPESSRTTASAIRYGLAPNLKAVQLDFALLGGALQISQLDEDAQLAQIGSAYDIVVAYGDLPNGQRSPVSHHVALIINPNIPPFTDPTRLAIVRTILDAAELSGQLTIAGVEFAALAGSPAGSVRIELANAGTPDGIRTVIGVLGLPAEGLMLQQLNAAGISTRALRLTRDQIDRAIQESVLNLAIIQWTTPAERAAWVARVGEANVLDVLTLPISYIAMPDLQVTFNEDGWPVPNRIG